MLAAITAILASFVAANGEPAAASLAGRCQYPDAVIEHRADTALASCNRLTIAPSADGTTLDFQRSSWGSTIQFSGAMTGPRMAVSRIRLRTGTLLAATGTCEVYYREGEISMVSCLARAGTRAFAANFVASRM